ncbi:GMC family oxidoreductase [Novosphingobium guangzhouense]|uniref:2-keto-gluconate dehydrogenase n=1 Tax=Novosphingobium guangzhouense TaxID=1850347 RepID=A0A2K2G019_9SPHN|nr:GMC family oxidoreductase [Novosphingobium guangzhouense]PNU04386.1 2-keto-gluconate dehydrogenase [Novosphingobium guangzhouense]
MTQFSLDDSSVFVVIGSGAGGGVLGNELAQKGHKVVCLEAGRRLEMSDIVNDEAEMFGKLTWLDRRMATGKPDPNFPVWGCKTVGGTTMHWTGACPRFEPHEMRARTTYGALPDTTLVDWPVTPEEIAPWYDKAEVRMGVTGRQGMPFLPPGNNFKVLEAGARKCGYTDIDTHNMAINSIERDDRPSCHQLGFCTSGCAVGAKWSTLYTEIPKAEETGRFELRPECMVTGIELGPDGRVSGVTYLHQGKRVTQKARAVAVAGNVVETTRLLLNNSSDRHPQGLANSSGLVGRNYMRHFTIQVMGVMPGKVHFHRQTHLAGVVRDERGHRPERGFAGGFLISTVPFTPEILAKNMIIGGWGRDLTEVLDKYDQLAGMLLTGEDPPQLSNRITLHPTERDGYGLPVPVIHYEDHPNTIAMKEYAWKAGRRIYEALGAENVIEMGDYIPATHNMGTARMGDDPRASVCTPFGRTHDVANLYIADGSLFPTAGGCNPTLTIVALALRQAQHIDREVAAGRL